MGVSEAGEQLSQTQSDLVCEPGPGISRGIWQAPTGPVLQYGTWAPGAVRILTNPIHHHQPPVAGRSDERPRPTGPRGRPFRNLSARFLLLGALSAVFDSAETSAAVAFRRMSRAAVAASLVRARIGRVAFQDRERSYARFQTRSHLTQSWQKSNFDPTLWSELAGA